MSQFERPTEEREYDFATDSVFADNFGNMILKDGRIYRPSWERTDTVVRFLPTRMSDGTWSPFRKSPLPNRFGDWIRRYAAVRMFGENKPVTMLLYNPVTQQGYDLHSNPCVMLRDALSQAIRKKQERPGWASLEKGAPGKGAPCSRSTTVYLSRVGIFRHKSQDKATDKKAPLGLAEEDKQHFFEITDTLGENLLRALEERNPQYQYDGGEVDYDQMYLNGDVVALDKGAFVTFFQAGHDPRQAQAEAATAQAGAPRQLTVGRRDDRDGEQREFNRYDLYVERTWKGFSANLEPFEEMLARKDVPWSRALQFLTDEQQAAVLQNRECFPADLFLYAWNDRKDWILPITRDRAVNRHSVLMGEDGVIQRTPVHQPAAAAAPAAQPASRPGPGRVAAPGRSWGQQSSEEVPESVAGPAAATRDAAAVSDVQAPAEHVPAADEGPPVPPAPPVQSAPPAAVPQPQAGPATTTQDPRAAAAMKIMAEARARAQAAAAGRPAVPERPRQM